MKKPLQFVATIVVALLFAQPLLAAAQCTPACAGKPTAQCCTQPGGMSMPGMSTAIPPASATVTQISCADAPCCLALRAALLPIPPPQAPVASNPWTSPTDPLPAASTVCIAASPAISPPGLQTARYILFHVFRI